VHFILGEADNPKVNAIALVRGTSANTHKASFERYQQTLIAIQEEKAAEKAKEELLFNEDLYDFEERIDGQGIFNQLLSYSYLFEGLMILFMVGFFRVIPQSK
jgi:hypothetical protein